MCSDHLPLYVGVRILQQDEVALELLLIQRAALVEAVIEDDVPPETAADIISCLRDYDNAPFEEMDRRHAENHRMKYSTCMTMIGMSTVLMTLSCIHVWLMGRIAWVPYELNISTNTCRKTANCIHRYIFNAGRSNRSTLSAVRSTGQMKNVNGREWVMPR